MNIKNREQQENEKSAHKKKISIHINRHSFAWRISLAFILLWTLLVLVVMGTIYLLENNTLLSNTQKIAAHESTMVVRQIDALKDTAESCINYAIVTINQDFVEEPKLWESPRFDDAILKAQFSSIGVGSMLLFKEISRLVIVLENGTIFVHGEDNVTRSYTGRKDIFRDLEKLNPGVDGKWLIKDSLPIRTSRESHYFVKDLRNIQKDKKIAYIIAGIPEETFFAVYASDRQQYTTYYLMNAYGTILSSSLRREVGIPYSQSVFSSVLASHLKKQKTDGFRTIKKEKYYQRMDKTAEADWTLSSMTDLAGARGEIRQLTANVLLVGLVLLFISSLLIVIISRQVSEPIHQLAEHMVSAGDDLPALVPEREGQDEAAVLTANFNTMIRRNGALLEKVKEDQTTQRHLELALLQTQIKPHFLYNTLNVAHSLISEHQYKTAKRVIELMVAHYRFVLNSGSEWVNIHEELKNAKNFLEIQQIRSAEPLTYQFIIPSDLMAFRIPKLTLQPLLENAIIHGIRPKKNSGHIVISADMTDEGIDIQIEDDGVGIPPEKIVQLLSVSPDTTPSSSFGIKNVNDRLKLFYGVNSGLIIRNNKKGGATFIIHIVYGGENHSEVKGQLNRL